MVARLDIEPAMSTFASVMATVVIIHHSSPRASQNVATTAILLRTMPEPSTPEGWQAHEELRALLECAVVQQAKSSASRRRGPKLDQPAPSVAHEKEASVHPEQQKAGDKRPSVHVRVGHNYDARNIINAHKRHKEDGASCGYHPRRGGRYDSGEDWCPSPEPLELRVFSQDIHNAPFPMRFRQPTNITKYSGEMNPELWLDDYRLACQLGGVDNNRFIIRNLPLFLTDSARAWLEHLPVRCIHNWADLIKVFVGNF
jgi:hypothetical protein